MPKAFCSPIMISMISMGISRRGHDVLPARETATVASNLRRLLGRCSFGDADFPPRSFARDMMIRELRTDVGKAGDRSRLYSSALSFHI